MDEKRTRSIEQFRQHYEGEQSSWGNHSGPGSNSFYTIDYRSFVSKFIRMNNISSVVDIGCGDWQFSRFLDFGSSSYLGYDVVEGVIRSNIARYASPSTAFETMPHDLDHVKGGDLLLMKDVLQHLSNEDIINFKNQVFCKFRYCLLTNSFEKLDTPQNVDIESGSFRCLDLTTQPYDLRGSYVMEFNSAVWERIRVLLVNNFVVT